MKTMRIELPLGRSEVIIGGVIIKNCMWNNHWYHQNQTCIHFVYCTKMLKAERDIKSTYECRCQDTEKLVTGSSRESEGQNVAYSMSKVENG